MSQQIDADGTTDQEARPGRPDRPVHERRVAAKLVSGPDTTCPGRQALFLHVYPVDSSTGAQPHAVRTLNLSALSSDTLAAVRRMSDDGASLFRTGQFGSVKAQCSQLLYRANGYLSRQRRRCDYALESCRHQFITNMVALKRSRAEISAMLDHLVEEDQIEEYRAKAAWEMNMIAQPRPMPADVAIVQRLLNRCDEHQRLLALAGKERRGHRRPRKALP